VRRSSQNVWPGPFGAGNFLLQSPINEGMFFVKTLAAFARDIYAASDWIMCVTGSTRPGPWGEYQARRFLRSEGFCILDYNWRCPAGELDIVALSPRRLHIVEVKTRRTDLPLRFRPVEAIHPKKLETLARLTDWYRRKHRRRLKRYGVTSCSIDLILISYSRTKRGRLRVDSLERIDAAVRPETRGAR
jgi:putative endonuclease